MSKRQRGVVLTDRGQKRLEAAIAAAQEAEKFGKRFTQAELSERANLSIRTIRKIREGSVPVDESSVKTLFNVFGLELETADYGQPEPTPQEPEPQLVPLVQRVTAKIDWGEKPDTALFFGRTEELATLSQWVMTEQCRVVTLLGMGGIGKTSLAAKLTDQIHDQFDYVIWRSLREAPPLEEILVRLIQFLSDQQETEINLPTRLGERLIRLLHYLREHRCLLVLDNLESILQAESTGQFRDGYEGYGELIQRIGGTEHQSCLLLTSRECPRELAPMAGDRLPVRLWSVGGIDPAAGREILKTKGLYLEDTEGQSQELIRRYSGNPQALHLVATAIQREFLGDVDDFLEEEGAAVEDVRTLLDQHLTRLAPLERSILFWLAINREPVGLDELMEDLLSPVTKREVRSALRGLSDRYLIETVGKQFTLQNVIMEFITDKFVEQVNIELQTQQFDLFHTHALIKATAKEFVRETQVRLILHPVADTINNLEQQVDDSLKTIRRHLDWPDGYAAGNLLNLLCQTSLRVIQVDFSILTLRQAHLKGITLQFSNLANSHLVQSSLTRSFSGVQTVAFSPNGELVATGDSNGNIQLWRVRNWAYLTTLSGHTNRVWSVAFSPDGHFLASSSIDGTIRLWSPQENQCIHVFLESLNRFYSVAFCPNGKFLASGSVDATIRLWDLQDYKCVHIFSGHTNWVYSISFSPDGKFLASGSVDATIRLWDLQDYKCVHIFSGHANWIESVSFSPDGRLLASGSGDSTIRLWDLQDRKCIHIFSDDVYAVRSVTFSPNGKFLASGNGDSTIRLWNLQDRQCVHVLTGHTNWVYSVAFSPDEKFLVSGSMDGTIRLWDLQISQCLHIVSGYINRVWSVAFSFDGLLMANGSDDFTIRLWNFKSRQCIHVFSGHTDWVYSVAFSPNGNLLASASGDSTIRLWDLQDRQCIHVFSGHTDWVYSVAFSPNGNFLASSGIDATIRLWDLQDYQCFHVLKGHEDTIRSVTFSQNGQFLASASDDATIRLWDVQKHQCIHVFSGHTNWVCSVAFSPDGQFLASCGVDGTIRVWGLQERKSLHIFSEHTNWVRSVDFSPDGRFLISSGDDTTIRLWDLQNHQCVHIFSGHTSGVWSVTFSSDSQVVASGGIDSTIRLWDVQSGECLAVLQVPRPYEDTNIAGIRGVTEAQRASLVALGAINGTVS